MVEFKETNLKSPFLAVLVMNVHCFVVLFNVLAGSRGFLDNRDKIPIVVRFNLWFSSCGLYKKLLSCIIISLKCRVLVTNWQKNKHLNFIWTDPFTMSLAVRMLSWTFMGFFIRWRFRSGKSLKTPELVLHKRIYATVTC